MALHEAILGYIALAKAFDIMEALMTGPPQALGASKEGGWMVQRLTDEEIRGRIRTLCLEQNGVDLRTALEIEGRILGLCEALGGDLEEELGKPLLESVGIRVKQVNPEWIFIEEE